jgi:hypothetical protein
MGLAAASQEAKPRDHTRVSSRRRVGRLTITVPCNKLIVDNDTATTKNAIILSDWREERGTTYLNLSVVIPPFNLPCPFPLSLTFSITRQVPSTPPTLRTLLTGGFCQNRPL